MDQELNFLKYRLEVARELPEGPYKTAVMDAIRRRMQALVRNTPPQSR
jgi:hypothetical protein